MKRTTVCVFLMLMAQLIFAVGKISAPISMNLPEKIAASSVQYLSGRRIQHEENYFILFFSLLDSNHNAKKAPVYVDIRIVNANGEEVYNQTKTVRASDYGIWSSQANGEQLLASIAIPDSEIKPSTSENGTVYFTVYNPEYISFDESELEINSVFSKGLPFKADYSNPVTVDPYTFYEDCENPLRAKKLYSGKPVTIQIKVSYIHDLLGTYTISASDYKSGGSYKSYNIEIEIDESSLDKLAEVKTGQKLTVCGFADTSSYAPKLTHAIIL